MAVVPEKKSPIQNKKSLIDSKPSLIDQDGELNRQIFEIFGSTPPSTATGLGSLSTESPPLVPSASIPTRERLYDSSDFTRPGFSFGTAKEPDITQTRQRPRPEPTHPVPDFLRKAAEKFEIELPTHATGKDLDTMVEIIRLSVEKEKALAEQKKGSKEKTLQEAITKLMGGDIPGAPPANAVELENDRLIKELGVTTEMYTAFKKKYSFAQINAKLKEEQTVRAGPRRP